MTKSLLLLSGGLDSTVLGKTLHDRGESLYCLHFQTGQLDNNSELRAACYIAATLEAPLEVINLSGIAPILGGYKADGNPGPHVLELGSLLIYTPALAYAHRLGMSKIYVGLTKLDADVSPEYTQNFLDAFSRLPEAAGFEKISFQAPLIKKTKAEIVRLGKDYTVPLAETWSCILREDTQCGICSACHSRKEAFKLAEIEDPTLYRHK